MDIITNHSIDTKAIGCLVANMILDFLKDNRLEEEGNDIQNSESSQREVGLHLSASVNYGAGTPPSGEHRASVCPEGEGLRAWLGSGNDSGYRFGPGDIRHTNEQPGRFQDPGGRCFSETGWSSVCSGSIPAITFQYGLASITRAVLHYRDPYYRRRRLLQPCRFQRSTPFGFERNNVPGGIALFTHSPPGRQGQQSKEGEAKISTSCRLLL